MSIPSTQSRTAAETSPFVHFKLILSLVLAGLIVLFVIQNVSVVEVRFLVWVLPMTLSLLIFLLCSGGIVVGWLLHSYWAYRRKAAGPPAREGSLVSLVAVAISLSVLFDAAPAGAQTPNKDRQASRATDKTVKKTPPASAGEGQSAFPILDHCKRAARDLRGPKRATFMTDCLKRKS